MSEFVRRWASWGAADAAHGSTSEPAPSRPAIELEAQCEPTDKTDKMPPGTPDGPKAGVQPTDKTDKIHSVSSVSSLPARSGDFPAHPIATPGSGRGPTPEDVEAMALDEFARAGLIVQVEVPRFGSDVLFVSDDVPEVEVENRGLTVYRAAELRKLYRWQPKPHDLRVIHDVKTILGQTITSVEKRRDRG